MVSVGTDLVNVLVVWSLLGVRLIVVEYSALPVGAQVTPTAAA